MLVRVLGDLEVVVDGHPADLGGPKPRGLVGLLVAAEGRPVPVERLVDEVWGSSPPARVEASLQSYVARLRRVLAPGRGAGGHRLRTHPGAYSLAVDEVDADRLATLVTTARDLAPTDPVGAEALLGQAGALWRGEPYGGLAWVPSLAAEATRLIELHRAAREERWRLRLDLGDGAAVAAELERAVRLDPLRERQWALLALAHYRAARQGDALAALRRAREVLADELGVDPGEELRRLEAAVLRQDPALDPPAPPAAGRPGDPPETATAGPPAPAHEHPDAAARSRRGDGTDGADAVEALVGREGDLAAVTAALDAVAAGRGRVVLVRGEPGIGKSRFGEAVVAAATARGFRSGRGTWEADGSPPLWGWSRAARELLGEDVLLGAGGEVLDAASQSFRLAELLLDRLREGPPSCLHLDDVHWADDDSLRLLRRVVAQTETVPLLLLVGLRDTGAATPAPLADVLASLARADPLRLELRGWDAEAVAAYVARRSGVRLEPAVAATLVARTGGNPFFVTELVRLLAAEGALADPGGRAWEQVPSGVRDVVRQRLSQLDDPVPEVLTAAAVVGRSFDLAVVARVTGRARDEVDAVAEQGLGLGLLVEDGPHAFRFAHALVGDALRETLPAPSRSRLHAAAAVALEEHHAGRVAEHAGELAEHYRLAGPAHARSAWAFARRAAAQAAAGSAHAEALRLSRLAADLQQEPGLATAEEREPVLVGLARALRRLARPVEAWDPCAAAARSALDDGRPADAAAALLEVTEDAIWGWRFRPSTDPAAAALWQEVLDARTDGADPLTPAARSLCEAALAVEHVSSHGPTSETTGLVDGALARARGAGVTPRDLVAVLQTACVALARHGLLHRRAVVADELVALTAREGDGSGLALALAKRGAVRGELGQWQGAHSDLVRAVQLARRHHHTPVALIAGWGVAVVLQSQDDLPAARAEVDRLERLEESLGMPGVGIATAHRAALLMLEGRLGEMEPQLRWAAEHAPSTMRDLHACALVSSGRQDEARLLLGAWGEQPPIVPDYLWLTMTVVRAQLWLELGDADAVADLRRDLEPCADLVAAGAMSSLFSGSVAHTLGRLALHQGDLPAARRFLGQAREAHDRMGLPGWVARTDAVLADVVAAGG